MPENWLITGTWRAGNHDGTRRRMLTKVTASPAPTSTRPAIPTQSVGATASTAWPSAPSTAPPAITRRGPIRSTSTPAGICSAA